MKLQIENNVTPDFLADAEFVNEIKSEDGSAEVTELLRSGIKAAQEGNRAEARNLLLQATEIEPKNENAWLWLASISEYPEELLIFLSNVLSVNPKNERALEWEKSTKSLLSRTFVQRGIEAFKEAQKEFAKQSFLQAIVHDDKNEMAWLWLASMSDVIEEKKSHLQKVLSIDPKNETALESLKSVKNEMARALLKKAKASALRDDRTAADKMLRELLNHAPDIADVWVLKAFMTDSFSEKVECFEKVLAIEPDSEYAQSCLNSMQSVLDRTAAVVDSGAREKAVEDNAAAVDESPEDLLELQAEAEPASPAAETKESEKSEADAKRVVIDGERFYSTAEKTDLPPQETHGTDDSQMAQSEAQAPPAAEGQIIIAEELKEYLDPAEGIDGKEPVEHPKYETSEIAGNASVAFSDTYDAIAPMPVDEPEAARRDAVADEEEEPVFVEYETEVSEAAGETMPGAFSENVPDPQKTEATVPCAFCEAENEPQNFICAACGTMLSASDVEMLLAHDGADRDKLERAIERMEIEKSNGEFSAEELRHLGIAHINLKNLRRGFEYLQESVQLNPNDVVLNSQVNSLAIRIAEIEEKQNVADLMPKNKTILVVDDSATVRKLISGKLEKCGHEVICAIDGMDALEKINEEIPDLILLDITMPRMDGYQVCKLIRSNDATKEVPVVMISGKDGFFDKVRGRMAGTTGYITKPFGPETLMKTVETYIN